ncbi:hypothetical protein QVD17_27075 [Tagetes erecta]|uniref:Uncharacterized protein n=1 Tax=Tagetes erecta TaxID=13708 RepID=A0AAD8K7U0_TARER|nr:hypothetical protein QVD17_27075 [Tagetes erecta]
MRYHFYSPNFISSEREKKPRLIHCFRERKRRSIFFTATKNLGLPVVCSSSHFIRYQSSCLAMAMEFGVDDHSASDHKM